MLVLTRRQGEEIVIAGNIRVTVVAVKGGQVRIGITAPPSVAVDRQEVHERRHDRPTHVLVPAEKSLAH
jgi:carbon storage regulator